VQKTRTLGILSYASGKAIDALELWDLRGLRHTAIAAEAERKRLRSRQATCNTNLSAARRNLYTVVDELPGDGCAESLPERRGGIAQPFRLRSPPRCDLERLTL